jgi:uncharacterized iron-regulated membrane protein
VLERHPGSSVSIYRPVTEPIRSSEVHILNGNESISVIVNPYNGEILRRNRLSRLVVYYFWQHFGKNLNIHRYKH